MRPYSSRRKKISARCLNHRNPNAEIMGTLLSHRKLFRTETEHDQLSIHSIHWRGYNHLIFGATKKDTSSICLIKQSTGQEIHGWGTNKTRDKHIGRTLVNIGRCSELHEITVFHDVNLITYSLK